MFKLVVLLSVAAIAAAKPSGIHGAVSYTAAVPAVSAAVSHQSRTDYVSSPVVATYAAAPIIKTAEVVATAPVVKTTYSAGPSVTHYAAVPVTGTAYSQNVHYAEKDVVTGYTSQIYKPNLGALATPVQTVSHQHVLAPARAVQTITPTVTKVEPEVTVKKVTVDVPVRTPVVSEVEVRTPVVAAAPVAAPVAVAPAVSSSYSYSVSAPAVAKVAAVAPAVSSYSVAAPVIHSKAAAVAAAPVAKVAAVAPAVSSYSYSVSAPAVATYAAAPAVATYAAAPAVATYAAAPHIATYAAAPAVATYAASPVVAARALNVPTSISTTEVRQGSVSQW